VDDGFGMALFEAMANGVPAIASRNCGASELLRSDRDCLLIDPFSVEQIKEAVLRLYESQELRERLSRSGAAAVAAFQAGGVETPYEEGLGRLLQSLESKTLLQSAV
jgi:glycosyltransferase involved in cell wall biosynthesis